MNHKKFSDFIDRNKWTFAKTYKDTAPHEYVVKSNLSPEDQKVFEESVVFIRENGYEELYYDKPYMCYNIGEFKYWTMGDPVEETEILNRTYIDRNKSFVYEGKEYNNANNQGLG